MCRTTLISALDNGGATFDRYTLSFMTHFTNRPCAAHGLISYRYKGPFGFIMIGASDPDDALREAARSLTGGVPCPHRLQVWNGSRYVNVVD